MKHTKLIFLLFFLIAIKAKGQFYNDLLKIYNKGGKLNHIESFGTRLYFKNAKLQFAIDDGQLFKYDVKMKKLYLFEVDSLGKRKDSIYLHILNSDIKLFEINGTLYKSFKSEFDLSEKIVDESKDVKSNNISAYGWVIIATTNFGERFKIVIRNMNRPSQRIEIIRNTVKSSYGKNIWEISFYNSTYELVEFYLPNINLISFKNSLYTSLMFSYRNKNKFRSIESQPSGKVMILDRSFQVKYNLFNKIIKKKSRGFNIINL